MNNFTMEDLLLYLYKETSPETTAQITAALASDWTLREQMNILTGAQTELNSQPMLSPRNETLDNIFAYAEKSVAELSENV
ncbi:MAG: hypothetical protein EOO03_02180 [Chitinophagaceae bacterium]|nr:MAG: hypothetical protein EOO03_02180 [Chitinophagaceae bacterium]